MDSFNRMMDPLEDRRFCVLRLLTVLLAGALTGAFCAKTVLRSAPEWLFSDLYLSDGVASFRGVFLSVLFPALSFAAFAFGHKKLIYCIFFSKGLMVSFLLCILAGTDCLFQAVLRSLVLHVLLPLPVSFYTASCLLSDPRGLRSPAGRLLIPLNVGASLLVFLLDVLFLD